MHTGCSSYVGCCVAGGGRRPSRVKPRDATRLVRSGDARRVVDAFPTSSSRVALRPSAAGPLAWTEPTPTSARTPPVRDASRRGVVLRRSRPRAHAVGAGVSGANEWRARRDLRRRASGGLATPAAPHRTALLRWVSHRIRSPRCKPPTTTASGERRMDGRRQRRFFSLKNTWMG
jgi:hypothetical protein